jgi:hypothetical protein
MGHPVKMSAVICPWALPDDQALAPIGVLDSPCASGAEHGEAVLAGLELQIMIVARAV